ncbi:MAG: STAS domain-containing protein [Candidatus Acidiferrales bacterium]|jgi:anti-sigma B factor antagonist
MADQGLQIELAPSTPNGPRILQFAGALALPTLFQFQTTMRAEPAPVTILDLTSLTYMDSAGLGALVGAFVSARAGQRKIVLVGVPERVAVLMDMTHVRSLIPSYATLDLALAALAGEN